MTKNGKSTALHLACKNINLDAVKELLLRKADPTIQCEDSEDTCLHILSRMLNNFESPVKKPLYDEQRDILSECLQVILGQINCISQLRIVNNKGETVLNMATGCSRLKNVLQDACSFKLDFRKEDQSYRNESIEHGNRGFEEFSRCESIS